MDLTSLHLLPTTSHVKNSSVAPYVIIILILFIYLTEKHSERGNTRGAEGEGEAGFPQSREPDAGLDSRTLGS